MLAFGRKVGGASSILKKVGEGMRSKLLSGARIILGGAPLGGALCKNFCLLELNIRSKSDRRLAGVHLIGCVASSGALTIKNTRRPNGGR